MKLDIEKRDQMTLFPEDKDHYLAEAERLLDAAYKMRGVVLAKMVRDFFVGLRRTIHTARTMRSLSDLSDATLADIGIHRSEIPAIAQALAEGTYDRNPVVAEAKKAAKAAAVKETSDDEPELPLAA